MRANGNQIYKSMVPICVDSQHLDLLLKFVGSFLCKLEAFQQKQCGDAYYTESVQASMAAPIWCLLEVYHLHCLCQDTLKRRKANRKIVTQHLINFGSKTLLAIIV